MKLGLGGIGEAFQDENFRRYSLGSILSWTSYFVQAVAVSWTTWELTHSTNWLAIIALLDAAANIALMPLGGVIAIGSTVFASCCSAMASPGCKPWR